MKGFGSYSDWPYYSNAPPPSNLSAFAAPFSFNRSTPTDVSAPFMDAYDFFPNPVRDLDSSKPFVYSGLQSVKASDSDADADLSYEYDACTNTKSTITEVQPYYSSYVPSPALHDHHSFSVPPNHWPPSSGPSTFDGFNFPQFGTNSPELGFAHQSAAVWGVGKGKHVGEGDGTSFSSKQFNFTRSNSDLEETLKQGNEDALEWEKQDVPASANQLDDKSGWWRSIKPVPVELSGTSVLQSPSMSVETHPEAPLKLIADSGNHHLSYTGSYDKHLWHGDKPLRVDTISSIPRTGLATDLNIENITADGDVGHNYFNNSKEAYRIPSPGIAGCFDLGHLRMHLEINEPSTNTLNANWNAATDIVDCIQKGRHGFQDPHAHIDNLSLTLNAIEDVNSIEKSFECGDRCNLAVDSPCWKGASAVHFSHYESSKASLRPEYVHKNEEYFGSVIQEHQIDLLGTENNVKKSLENLNNHQMHTEVLYQQTSSAGSPRKCSVTKLGSEDCNPGGANTGPIQSVPSCDHGLQNLDDNTEMKKNSVPTAKPTDYESGSSHLESQIVEENKLMSQKQHASCIGDTDAEYNMNKCLEYGVPHTAEHTLSSPSSAVGTNSTPEKSAGKVSTQKLDVQLLINTMQNLSELLLNRCLNEACELNERDCDVLNKVISNLNTCALKNTEQVAPVQECLFDQPETSRCTGESCELQQTTSLKRPELTKIGPENSKVEPGNPLVAEANLHFRSGRAHWNLSDSISPRDDGEMTKANNMTKAIKRILSENFHDDEGAEPQTALYKNLWLEAEAALCSTHYRARYNQMKIEMDLSSYKERDIEDQSKSEVVPTLSHVQSSATKMHNYQNPESFAQDFEVSTDMNKPNAMTPEGKGDQYLDSFIQNCTVPSTDKEAGRNDQASVMARYRVLKARVVKSCFDDTSNLEEPSDIADKSDPGEGNNLIQVHFGQDSPSPEQIKAENEASVLARFRILKSRVEGSNSNSSEGKPTDGVGSTSQEMNDTIVAKNVTEGRSLDNHVSSAVMHPSSYIAVDKSMTKEFHLGLEDNQEIQPYGTCEFQLPGYYSDYLTSDWEHVEKKSL